VRSRIIICNPPLVFRTYAARCSYEELQTISTFKFLEIRLQYSRPVVVHVVHHPDIEHMIESRSYGALSNLEKFNPSPRDFDGAAMQMWPIRSKRENEVLSRLLKRHLLELFEGAGRSIVRWSVENEV